MGKKALAILAFNVYAFFLISAFQDNSASLFDTSLISQMRLDGAEFDPVYSDYIGNSIFRAHR